MPNTPNVDVIKLSEMYEKAVFDNTVYEEFLDKLRANMDKNKENTRKIEQEEIDDKAQKELGLKSASNPNPDWEVTPYTLDDGSGVGEGNYAHKMNVPVVYTYYKKIYFSSGTNVDFETFTNIPYTSTAVDPVMYLFSDNNPNYAWSNDDGGPGYQSRITVTIPSSGYYYLVLRAYSSSYASTSTGMQGVVDIYNNGNLYQDDAPVSGYMMSCGTSNEGTLNYFTAYSTGTPKLWLAQGGATSPIKFHGSRYWYVPPMDYTWYDDARFSVVKSGDSYMSLYLLVSSEYAWYVYWGNCDLYGSAKTVSNNMLTAKVSGTDSLYFPNLNESDGIQSAPSTNVYNCAAWAGGIDEFWFWGCKSPDAYSSCNGMYYGSAYIWSTWDNYFENNPPRYTGAMDFTRDNANSSNGDVAVWSTNGNISGVTHFSVRREGNLNPHGYDWESKPGGQERLFHPRDALEGPLLYGSRYGYIFDYYQRVYEGDILKSAKTKNIFSLKESIEAGLTIIPEITLSNEELKKIEELKNIGRLKSGNSESNMEVFDNLYQNWIRKCQSDELKYNSDIYRYFDLKECNELESFYYENEELVLPYLMEMGFDENVPGFQNQITAMFFMGVTGEKYKSLIEDVKEEWRENNFTSSGQYIAPIPTNNTKNYIKKLLGSNNNEESQLTEMTILKDNHEDFNVFPNPVSDVSKISLTLKQNARVSLIIYDQLGNIVDRYFENEELVKGRHQFNFYATGLNPGIYICKLTTIEGIFTRKVLVIEK